MNIYFGLILSGRFDAIRQFARPNEAYFSKVLAKSRRHSGAALGSEGSGWWTNALYLKQLKVVRVSEIYSLFVDGKLSEFQRVNNHK